MKDLGALALAVLLTGCAVADAPTLEPTTDFAPGQHPYGVKGSITQQQFADLQGLSWPQSYADINNKFGRPTHRLEGADYYQLEGTNTWVVIEYSGTQATGYRTE